MNVENYIESINRELSEKEWIDNEFIDLYSEVENESLRIVLSSLHKHLSNLFKTMNMRLPTRDTEQYYWADPSRHLIYVIEKIKGLKKNLKGSNYEFAIDTYYDELITKCDSFLRRSGGSLLPKNMDEINLYYLQPIFIPGTKQKVSRGQEVLYSNLKSIGEGSYSLVYKFKDDYYDKRFVLKRAKKDLNTKEVERFKREFIEMKKLYSPYIVEVYTFDDEKNEYIMEYMDSNLDSFMSKKNNELTNSKRIGIGLQILKAFKYLHSKKLLHRDISPKNILLKEYDDVTVVKISDFGLVKIQESSLTSMNTEFKGYFNDPSLMTEGFDSYSMEHEMYALTKLLYFVMTGKTNTTQEKKTQYSSFIKKGLNTNIHDRFRNIDELKDAFLLAFKERE